MKKRQKGLERKSVLFNASVVLSGLRKPSGGSGKLLFWAKNKQIKGVISEVILDEILRHAEETGLTAKQVENRTLSVFPITVTAPAEKTVSKFRKVVADYDDAHVLASAQEIKADFLVSLDKKHILSLKGKRNFPFKILTPGELIEEIAGY